MQHNPTEQFRILFLDRKNVLIADEIQQSGTVDHTPVYPREVVRRALDLSASAVILVHNHRRRLARYAKRRLFSMICEEANLARDRLGTT